MSLVAVTGGAVELHKSRAGLVLGGFMLAVGLFVLLGTRIDGPMSIVWVVFMGGGSTLVGGALVAYGLRPFRFHIGPDGLTVRKKGINRLVRWNEVEAIILDQSAPGANVRTPSPQLLLVPATGVDLGLPMTTRSSAHDGSCAVLLELDDVKESPDQVAAALAQFTGRRFVNAIQLRRDRFAEPNFTVVLRGYDMATVHDLVRKGQDALAPGALDGVRRVAARVHFDGARTDLPIAVRGYDRTQVDAYLRELSAELAKLDTDPTETGAGS